MSFEELKLRVTALKDSKDRLKLRIARERNSLNHEERISFEYKLNKYLFELKTHKHIQKHHDKAVALVSKFCNQEPPEDCTNEQFKEWDRNKLTHAKVLSIIYRYIKQQYEIPRKEVALVKTSYGYKLKEYAPHLLDKVERQAVSMNNLIIHDGGLPAYNKMTPK
ncbi:MAG: helicase, partial [Rikenellaceae bacterium]